MFLPDDDLAFTRALEAGWLTVRRELAALRPALFAPWPEKELYDDGWTVFGLIAFGQRLDANRALCPETAALLDAIPGCVTAGFSVMAPGAHIRPHVGYTRKVLRCHLGLVVPAGCALRVGSETRTWSEGRCLVFDDTTEHEAWNRSDAPRTVLLLDVLRDGPGAAPGPPPRVAHALASDQDSRSLPEST